MIKRERFDIEAHFPLIEFSVHTAPHGIAISPSTLIIDFIHKPSGCHIVRQEVWKPICAEVFVLAHTLHGRSETEPEGCRTQPHEIKTGSLVLRVANASLLMRH